MRRRDHRRIRILRAHYYYTARGVRISMMYVSTQLDVFIRIYYRYYRYCHCYYYYYHHHRRCRSRVQQVCAAPPPRCSVDIGAVSARGLQRVCMMYLYNNTETRERYTRIQYSR